MSRCYRRSRVPVSGWNALAFLVLLVLGSDLCLAAPKRELFARAFGIGAVDLSSCRIVRDGEAHAPSPDDVRSTLGLGEHAGGLGVGRCRKAAYLIVLDQRVAVGTMAVSPAAPGSENGGQTYCLKPGVEGPPDPDNPGQWTRIDTVRPQAGLRWHTFPKDFTTRAFLYVDSRGRGGSALPHWLFFRRRLFSFTRRAMGIGEDAPFGSSSNAIPSGRAWENTRPDPEENSRTSGKILRPPVSDINPAWYILSWERPRRIEGLFLRANIADAKFYAFKGDPAENPAVAPEKMWDRIRPVAERRGPAGRRVVLRPLRTSAIKLKVLKTRPLERGGSDAVLRIECFHALRDLGEEPVPRAEEKVAKGFSITHQMPHEGVLSMRIESEKGGHVRQLLAQEKRGEGTATENWNLRDDRERRVAPGTYRWKALSAPPLKLIYRMSPYPNVNQFFPERTPWMRGHSGADGWLADHTPLSSGTTLGDRLYFGAWMAEGGVAFIECDLEGKKLWGRHGFGPWCGTAGLTAGEDAVYIHALHGHKNVFRLDPDGHEMRKLLHYGRPDRTGRMRGFAASGGKLYMSFGRPEPFVENATTAALIDFEHCIPKYPEGVKEEPQERVPANPRQELLRLLRLTGSPPGQRRHSDRWPMYIDSTERASRHQYILIAFKKPVPVGSVAFPHPGGKLEVQVAALKEDAPYPPQPTRDRFWTSFPRQNDGDWDVIPAPERTRTRALRIRISRPGDEFTDLMAGEEEDTGLGPAAPGALPGPEEEDEAVLGGAEAWQGRLEGLKILRRRLSGVFESATVRVSSGEVGPGGVWQARRDEPLSETNPAIYLMEWEEARSICGLAVKEIDGAVTKVDVWDGGGEIPLRGEEGWREVATYKQERRYWYQPDFKRNHLARYMDGYVDFHGSIRTRAVRLRVVKQWYDHGPHRPYGMREDRAGKSLDTTRCRVWGVEPLAHLGEEVPLEPVHYRRLSVYDGETGELERELSVHAGWELASGPEGELFCLKDGAICRLDRESGVTTPIVSDLERAGPLAVGPDGRFYVNLRDEHLIRVYDPDGEPVRTIGHPGGLRPGPWDPYRLGRVNALVPDRAGNLWVVEGENEPRRVVQFKTDGTFVKEILGNTSYGGGGVLNPHDRSELFFGRVLFDLDWENHTSRVRGLLAKGLPRDLVPVRHGGRTYLVSRALSHERDRPVGQVYIYDRESVTARPVAAFGNASKWPPFRSGEILGLMEGGRVPADYRFLWQDENGNGGVDAVEMELTPVVPKQHDRICAFDDKLNCMAGSIRYEVREVLENGTPIYERTRAESPGCFRLDDGRTFDLEAGAGYPHGGYSHEGVAPGGRGANHGGMETHVRDEDGEVLWRYRTVGWSGLHVEPWIPGYVAHQFSVIGHATPERGELGEFVVVHSNTGQWNIWTADGFLAGPIFRHKLDPTSRPFSAKEEALNGTRLDPLTTGQEHFHGYFTRTDDGHYYAIAGHNQINVIEVDGIERFRRREGTITVTAEDLRRVRQIEVARERKKLRSRSPIVYCLRSKQPPEIDGELEDGEWPDLTPLPGRDRVGFAAAWDRRNLYLCWRGAGNLSNSGEQFQRYFKTGGCLDFKMQTDPDARPGRTRPVRGDLRLLITWVEDRPEAVLYEPVAPGAPPEESWSTRTRAMGETRFDRVVRLRRVRIVRGEGGVEAAVPLESIGLEPRKGMRVKMDWGVLVSAAGRAVQQRLYWANRLANGTSDVALEARLKPHLWGHMIFAGTKKPGSGPSLEQEGPALIGEKKEEMGEEEIEDLLLGE